jgi:hypothetical protein
MQRERGVQYNRTFGGEATTPAELLIVIQEEARAWDMAGHSASKVAAGSFDECFIFEFGTISCV